MVISRRCKYLLSVLVLFEFFIFFLLVDGFGLSVVVLFQHGFFRSAWAVMVMMVFFLLASGSYFWLFRFSILRRFLRQLF